MPKLKIIVQQKLPFMKFFCGQLWKEAAARAPEKGTAETGYFGQITFGWTN